MITPSDDFLIQNGLLYNWKHLPNLSTVKSCEQTFLWDMIRLNYMKSFSSQTLLAEIQAYLTPRHISRLLAQCGIAATSFVSQHLTSHGLCCYHLELEASWNTIQNSISDSWNATQHLLQADIGYLVWQTFLTMHYLFFNHKSSPLFYHIYFYNLSPPPSLFIGCHDAKMVKNGSSR